MSKPTLNTELDSFHETHGEGGSSTQAPRSRRDFRERRRGHHAPPRQGRLSRRRAGIVQQYLAAGLLDDMLISVVPILLGNGVRLFDNLGDARPRLEQLEAIEAPGVAHIRYRVA
jgi:hypothetical protein